MFKKGDRRRHVSLNKDKAAFKAGVWYLIGNVIQRAFGFLTVPIFTRLLTVDDYGQFGNITSWVTILLPIVTMELYVALNRGRFDYEEDVNGFVASISFFSLVCISIIYILSCVFIDNISVWLSTEPIYIHCMFLYFLGFPAYNIIMLLYRYQYDYKRVLVLVFLNTISSLLISIILVFSLDNRLLGRCIGYVAPTLVMGVVCYFLIFKKSFSIKTKYIKYALRYGMPYVPHVLGMHLLGSSDKIMIVKMIGTSENAIYSVAVSFISIVSILLSSLNQAWAPWGAEMLHEEQIEKIRKIEKLYILLFCSACVIVNFLTPEIIVVLGGEKYISSTDCIAPLLGGVVCQFGYTLYVNVEMYFKKPLMVSLGTGLATALNIGLNYWLLPLYGFKVAAYTTLASYLILFIIHSLFIILIHKQSVFSIPFNFGIVAVTIIIIFITTFLYKTPVIRFFLLGMGVIILLMVYKKGYLNRLINIVKKK